MPNNKEKIITGYPHIDLPWMDSYPSESLSKKYQDESIYDFFLRCSKGREDNVATDFYGSKITYGQMIENIENLSKGLAAIGVNRQDRILSILPTLSTTANLFYATSKVGGVSDFYDPRPDSINPAINGRKMLSIIKKERIKHIIVFDQCYEILFSTIENELKELGIESVVIFSSSDAMNLKGKTGFLLDEIDKNGYNLASLRRLKEKLAEMKKNEEHIKEVLSKSSLRILRYNDLVENSRFVTVQSNKFIPNELAIIVHTSGTSGAMPKALPLTNENMNKHVQQIFATGDTYQPGDSVFQMLPYFASFGVGDVAHYGFCCGATMIQIPEFTPDDLPRRIYRTKPNMIVAAPTMLNPLLDNHYLDGKDLSFLKRITVGGGEYPRQKEVVEFLKAHNAEKCRVEYGYGLSQTAGSTNIAYRKEDPIGSVGKPLPYTIVALVDPLTGNALKFDDDTPILTGEAYISGPSVTSGILDGEVVAPHTQIDGIDFLPTGDLINMDREGNMSFNTRLDRTFTRFDGYKYKPYVMEEIIKEDPRVVECVITEYHDELMNGFMPIANIVLDSNYSFGEQFNIIKEIVLNELANNPNISTRQIPAKIRILSEIPLTKNSKYNYKLLRAMGINGEEFTVAIEETNLAVGDIKVLEPNKINRQLTKKPIK